MTERGATRAPASLAMPLLPRIEARGLRNVFSSNGTNLPVLEDVTLSVAPAEFVSIIGPSGCGKSTLLTLLAGLMRPNEGRVFVDGTDVTGKIGLAAYMPQRDLLLPWKRVLDNTVLGLEMLGVPRRQARDEARAWFPSFGLEGFEQYYPSALSGGMRQRAALLRTFLTRRDILLLDEPLGALDALTRMEMQTWLVGIWESFHKTIVLVTHDVDEAIFLSHRVYVMTSRPSRIGAVVEVRIPRPRVYKDVVTSRAFAELKGTILSCLSGGNR